MSPKIFRLIQGNSTKIYSGSARYMESTTRNVFNKTHLMLAAMAGNTALICDLLKIGADTELVDNYGLTAWQSVLQNLLADNKFPSTLFSVVHELLAPQSLSLKVDDRLIKIDARQGDFMLFHIFFSLLRRRINNIQSELVPLSAPFLERIMTKLPTDIMSYNRKKRAYISSLLSKNEVNSANPYNKKLFIRKEKGYYILNPCNAVRLKDVWIDVYRLSNIEFILKIPPKNRLRLSSDIHSNKDLP